MNIMRYSKQGGDVKSQAIRAGDYLSSRSVLPKYETPVFKLLQELRIPFKSPYRKPPTTGDREKVKVSPSRSDWQLLHFFADVGQYDQDVEYLESSTWCINKTKTSLDENVWPTEG